MSKRLLLTATVAACVMSPLSAQAGNVRDFTDAPARIANWLGVDSVFGLSLKSEAAPAPVAAISAPASAPLIAAAPITVQVTKADLAAMKMPAIQLADAAPLADPTVEKGFKKFYCVEYARLRSGLAVFGDAKYWWERAKNLYTRAAHPVEEAVMVFSGSKRLKRGHVAVVTDIVSPREIRVEQANWMNRGEIDHATPVLDVSSGNDWSQVRVWDVPSRQFGSRIYAISGFIVKGLDKQARAD